MTHSSRVGFQRSSDMGPLLRSRFSRRIRAMPRLGDSRIDVGVDLRLFRPGRVGKMVIDEIAPVLFEYPLLLHPHDVRSFLTAPRLRPHCTAAVRHPEYDL